MPAPDGWKPKTQYLVACPDRGRDHVSVQTFTTAREAQDIVNYWRRYVPGSEYCVVEAVTTYRVVGGEAPVVPQLANRSV